MMMLKVIASTIILCIMITTTGQHRIFYILPDGQPLSKCPVENCYSLDGAFAFFFTSDTTVALVEGTHVYSNFNDEDDVLIFELVYNFMLTAMNNNLGATIKCNGSVGFKFMYVRNLIINGIKFEECGANVLQISNYVVSATLHIVISCNVVIKNVTVAKGRGFGLLVYNPHGRFQLQNSNFFENQLNFGIFKLPLHAHFTCLSQRAFMIEKSSFINGNTDPNEEVNYYYTFSSGITLITFSSKDPSHQKTNIVIRDTVLCNNTGLMGNLYIEYNACTTRIYLERLNSSDCNIGAYLRPRLWISPYCTVVTTRGKASIKTSVLSNASLYLSVPQEDSYDVEDLVETENPELLYMHSITLHNVAVVNYNGGDKAFFVSYIHHVIMSDVIFEKNMGKDLMVLIESEISLHGNSVFRRNIGGIAAYLNTRLIFSKGSSVQILDMYDDFNTPIHVSYAYIEVQKNSEIIFKNNTGVLSGAIAFMGALVSFVDTGIRMSFINNRGVSGGALAFYDKARLDFGNKSEVQMTFIDNYASKVGGAIFVKDVEYLVIGSLGGNEPFLRLKMLANVTLTLLGNTAELAGCAIYGGWIDATSTSKIPNITIVSKDTCNSSIVSSNPKRLCICTNLVPNCNTSDIQFDHIPGQPFIVSAVAVGQRFGIVPSTVQAQFINPKSTGLLDETQYVQIVDKKCTQLTYTIRSSNKQEKIILTIASDDVERPGLVNVPGSELLFDTLELTFNLKECPYGFTFDVELKQCVCESTLINHKVRCDSQTLKIYRLASRWINVALVHLKQNQSSGVIIHDHCPYDYCITPNSDSGQQIDLLHPDEQCNYNRSGILCGACQSNLSHVLGTSKCKQCTKPWIALIVPLVALAGILLVIGLIYLNLTVTVGTINGLIFYANIVRANHATFFPQEATKSFLSMFLAWLNLDLGIETCIYNGLDVNIKTWLQFLFPLYIWFLVIAIIVSSHYSTIASRLSGNNAVQVLATLFLLSYAKLLRIIITTFSSTQLIYPNGYYKWVWLYDGNVDYLKGKHIPLFICSLFLLLFVSFPYTVGLLCIQWLQKFSNLKMLFWVGKLLPLFDAYTGPYKIKHRYWTGLLLLLRVGVFLVFSLNTRGDPTINLLIITALVICMFSYLSMVGGVYKQWYLNLIEIVFLSNLGILSATSLFNINSNSSAMPVTYASVGVAFTIFIIISVYHFIIKLNQSRNGKLLVAFIREKLRHVRIKEENEVVMIPTDEVGSKITYSEVNLENTNSL